MEEEDEAEIKSQILWMATKFTTECVKVTYMLTHYIFYGMMDILLGNMMSFVGKQNNIANGEPIEWQSWRSIHF